MTRLLAVAAMLSLAACGGTPTNSSDTTTSTTATATATADSTEPTATAVVAAQTTTTDTTITAARSAPATTTNPSTTTPSTTTPSTTTATTTTATTTTSTVLPPPCVPTTDLVTASGRQITLRADGLTGPAPAIVVIHGYTGTPSGIERVADLTAFGNANGIAVAYPLGTPTDVGGFAWDTGAAVFANSGFDDVGALVEMLTAIESTGCVDADRVVVTGESNGGGMTLAALCDQRLAGRFRSAVMVIPAVDEGVLERCDGNADRTTPLIAVAGRTDLTAPFDGGNGLLPQLDWFERIATSRGCSGVDDAAPITPFADSYVATGCGACTELIAVVDGPHTWPGSLQTNGNLVAGTFDLNRRVVDDLLAPEPGCLSTR